MFFSRVIVQPEDAAYLCFVLKSNFQQTTPVWPVALAHLTIRRRILRPIPRYREDSTWDKGRGGAGVLLPFVRPGISYEPSPASREASIIAFRLVTCTLPTYHLRRRRPSLKLGILTAAVMWNTELPEQQKRNQSITLQSPSTSRSPNLPPPSWLAL
jgi:hypothetical protein